MSPKERLSKRICVSCTDFYENEMEFNQQKMFFEQYMLPEFEFFCLLILPSKHVYSTRTKKNQVTLENSSSHSFHLFRAKNDKK